MRWSSVYILALLNQVVRERQCLPRGLDKLRDIVTRVITSRKDPSNQIDIPFIDALLQSAVPDDQVICM